MTSISSVELRLKGSACTDSALAFQDADMDEPIWIPRSQIQNLDELIDGLPAGSWWTINEEVEIHIPTWLVEEKGLDLIAEEIEGEVR